MDILIDPSVHQRRRFQSWRNILAIVLLLAVALVAINRVISPSVERDNVRIATVEMGEVSATVSAAGIVVPRFEQLITSPLDSKIEQAFIKE
jgi:HlyD family secretion protein